MDSKTETNTRRGKVQPTEIDCSPHGCAIAQNAQTGAPVLVRIDDTLVNKVLASIRERGKAESRWDINKAEGEIAERSLLKLLSSNDATIEVKRDFKVGSTGNVAIEGEARGKPSGISVTEAEWWALVLDGEGYNSEVVVLIKTDRLKRLIKQINPVRGGDGGNAASIKLLPVFKLLQRL